MFSDKPKLGPHSICYFYNIRFFSLQNTQFYPSFLVVVKVWLCLCQLGKVTESCSQQTGWTSTTWGTKWRTTLCLEHTGVSSSDPPTSAGQHFLFTPHSECFQGKRGCLLWLLFNCLDKDFCVCCVQGGDSLRWSQDLFGSYRLWETGEETCSCFQHRYVYFRQISTLWAFMIQLQDNHGISGKIPLQSGHYQTLTHWSYVYVW